MIKVQNAGIEDYKRLIINIFFAQKKIIFLTTLLIFTGSVAIAFFWPPTYASHGSILVKGKKTEKSPGAIESTETRVYPVSKEDLSSEKQILTSYNVMEETIKELQKKGVYPKLSLKSKEFKQSVYGLMDSVKTLIVPSSNVIKITLKDKNPKKAVDVLTVLMDKYILYRKNIYTPSTAEDFFSKQADTFKTSLEKQEDKLLQMAEKTKAVDPEKQIQNNLVIKQGLEAELSSLKNDRIEKKLYLNHLRSQTKQKDMQFYSYIDNPVIVGLSDKLQDLYIERGKLLRIYTEQSSKIQFIDKQVKNTFGTLKKEVKAYESAQSTQLKILEEKVKGIEKQLKGINDHNVDLRKQLILERRIQRESDIMKISYETLSKRREEVKIAKDVYMNDFFISILTKAFPSDGPVYPKKRLVLIAGLIVGFMTGASLGFLNEYFDHTFKRPSDVDQFLGLNVIMSIPHMSKR